MEFVEEKRGTLPKARERELALSKPWEKREREATGWKKREERNEVQTLELSAMKENGGLGLDH